jgi:outer membrane protein OmpA-like peptidoglycan-associated protein
MVRRSLVMAVALSSLLACGMSGGAVAQRAEPPMQPLADDPPSYVVFFDSGKAVINARGMATIREASNAARKPGVRAVDVAGHTDRAGSDRANEMLSLRRARAVRDQLVRLGVRPALLAVSGLGESKPFMPTEDGDSAPENRRVEIVIR